MQRIGLSLLGIGRRITELEGALKTCESWRNFNREFATRLPVLLYHHVGPVRPQTHLSLTVSPAAFARQVRYLERRGYQGISPSDWLRWRFDGKGLPEKPVLLTFDDGYTDLVQFAFPVLEEHGFKAAVYVVTERMGGTNTWDEVRGGGCHRLLTADQIQFWVKRGIEFGAHSRTHADLTTCSSSKNWMMRFSGASLTSNICWVTELFHSLIHLDSTIHVWWKELDAPSTLPSE